VEATSVAAQRQRVIGIWALIALAALVLGCYPPVTIEPAQLPEGIVGQPYEVVLNFSGAEYIQGAHTFRDLPPGLRFAWDRNSSATARISGTPTTAGSWTFKVIAFGPQYMFGGSDGEREYTLVVR